MMRAILLATAAALLSDGAVAQTMPSMDMPGHPDHRHAPAKPATAGKQTQPHAPPQSRSPASHNHDPARQREPDHAAIEHGSSPPADHSAMPGMAQDQAVSIDDAARVGTALPAGDKPAPAPPVDHYADRDYGAAAMAASRAALALEHGGDAYSQVMMNIAEYQARKGRDGYRWDGEAWFGGDINRLTIKSEGEGAFGRGAERAEVQTLYSRALDPYWNLQAGLRYDIHPDPSRTYATVGVEGLAPYWFEIEAALFVSDKGDVLGRVEAWHDMRLTQRLVLQPRAEINLAAQDMPAQRIGSGLSDAAFDLRLRYEIRREFAPYIGISWEHSMGETARLARRAGERGETTSFVLGIRTWF